MRKPILATRVSPYVNTSVKQIVKNLGITVSEYIRSLILQDLNSKKFFDGEHRNTDEQPEEEPFREHSILNDNFSREHSVLDRRDYLSSRRRRTKNQQDEDDSVYHDQHSVFNRE